MTHEHEFEAPKKELEIPVSIYLTPEKLKDLAQMSRGEPLTWGTTPLDPYRPDIVAQQNVVHRDLDETFPKKSRQVPYGLKWGTARFIHDNYLIRRYHRETRNHGSYLSRGKVDISDYPLEVLDFIDRSIAGNASPAEIILAAQLQQIPTAELGSVTHLYGGERLKLLKPMRAAIRDGIEYFGGTVCESKPEYEVAGVNYFNQDYDITEPCLLMTRTTKIGEITQTIKVIERSSFVLVIPRLDTQLASAIKQTKYGKTWADDITSISGFEETVSQLLQTDQHDKAVPISTTSVYIDEQLVEKLLKDESYQKERRWGMTTPYFDTED